MTIGYKLYVKGEYEGTYPEEHVADVMSEYMQQGEYTEEDFIAEPNDITD